jgi:hypothetical protein
MSDWSPHSFPRQWLAGGAVLYVALVAYGLLVVQEILLFAVFPPLLFGSIYFAWRLLRAIEAVADGVQRIARQMERE